MYTDYFRLSEQPFSLTPDPRYLFMSERHREGLAHLVYGVQQPGGFVQLTGEVGSGKTTLSRCLVRQLPPETDVALILNPRLTVIELLATVCDELRIPYPAEAASNKVLIDALNKHLLEAHAQGRRTVLIIDEAQNLHSDVLEQIRLLTNLETSKEKLLQIILIGQPELLSILKREGLRQLAQRITARYHLLALSRRETYAYIEHRLLVAGRRDPLFTRPAMRCVYRHTGGVPRLINIICDRALLGAYAVGTHQITSAIVHKACRETRGVISWRLNSRLIWATGIVALFVLILASAVFLRSDKLRTANHGAPARQPAADPAPNPVQPKFSPASNKGTEALTKKPTPSEAFRSPPAGVQLIDLLSGSSSYSAFSSFTDLCALWKIKPPSNSAESGCKAVQAQGFDCLNVAGSWPKLHRYNVPAILEFILPTGVKRRAALVGLNNETGIFVVGGHEYGFPLSEIDRVWDGSFTILWKRPFDLRRLVPGAQGEDVIWIRRALDALEKKATPAIVPDLYDDELQKRIVAFQRDQSLIQDGSVGKETLVRLTLALDGPNAPSLSGNAR